MADSQPTKITLSHKIALDPTQKQQEYFARAAGTARFVSRTANRWFVSIQVELTDYHRLRTAGGIVGVDLGIATSVTLSTGEEFQGPKAMRKRLRKLRRLSKRLSRKQRGSNRRNKARAVLAKFHARIANIRKDWLHKLTTKLCRENQALGVEDLHVRGMFSNRKLARAVGDECFSEFRRQLTYKSLIYRNFLEIVDRWFPSSKTCHQCGEVNEGLTLKDRTFVCVNPACSWVCPRDYNAALNLKPCFEPTTAGLAESHARGEASAGRRGKPDGETGLDEPRTNQCSLVGMK